MKRPVPFYVVSTIMENRSCPSISDGNVAGTFVEKNACISTPSGFASAMIRVFPSFEHSTGVSATRRQF